MSFSKELNIATLKESNQPIEENGIVIEDIEEVELKDFKKQEDFMKIALFSDTYLPDINGVATSTNILRNELVRLGHDVLVVTSELPSDSDYDISLDDQILRVPGLEIQALYGYRACNIFSFKGMKEIKKFAPEVIRCV